MKNIIKIQLFFIVFLAFTSHAIIEAKYIYRESTGGHTWANWRIYLSEFAPQLFR